MQLSAHEARHQFVDFIKNFETSDPEDEASMGDVKIYWCVGVLILFTDLSRHRRSNNLLKDRKLLRVDLQHIKSYNKQLAAALEAAPADYLPLVRAQPAKPAKP